MSESERQPTPQEISRWTREFLNSDFWKLVVKPEFDTCIQVAIINARKTTMEACYGFTQYANGLSQFEIWLETWREMDRMADTEDLQPGYYVRPRFPKLEGEE